MTPEQYDVLVSNSHTHVVRGRHTAEYQESEALTEDEVKFYQRMTNRKLRDLAKLIDYTNKVCELESPDLKRALDV